jgi:hypothetical protein
MQKIRSMAGRVSMNFGKMVLRRGAVNLSTEMAGTCPRRAQITLR